MENYELRAESYNTIEDLERDLIKTINTAMNANKHGNYTVKEIENALKPLNLKNIQINDIKKAHGNSNNGVISFDFKGERYFLKLLFNNGLIRRPIKKKEHKVYVEKVETELWNNMKVIDAEINNDIEFLKKKNTLHGNQDKKIESFENQREDIVGEYYSDIVNYSPDYLNVHSKEFPMRYENMACEFLAMIKSNYGELHLQVAQKFEIKNGCFFLSKGVKGEKSSETLDLKCLGIYDANKDNYLVEKDGDDYKFNLFDFGVSIRKMPKEFFTHENFALLKMLHNINGKYFNEMDKAVFDENIKIFEDKIKNVAPILDEEETKKYVIRKIEKLRPGLYNKYIAGEKKEEQYSQSRYYKYLQPKSYSYPIVGKSSSSKISRSSNCFANIFGLNR